MSNLSKRNNKDNSTLTAEQVQELIGGTIQEIKAAIEGLGMTSVDQSNVDLISEWIELNKKPAQTSSQPTPQPIAANQTQAGLNSINVAADRMIGTLASGSSNFLTNVETKAAARVEQLRQQAEDALAERLAMQAFQAEMGAMSQVMAWAGDAGRFFDPSSPVVNYQMNPAIIDIPALPSSN